MKQKIALRVISAICLVLSCFVFLPYPSGGMEVSRGCLPHIPGIEPWGTPFGWLIEWTSQSSLGLMLMAWIFIGGPYILVFWASILSRLLSEGSIFNHEKNNDSAIQFYVHAIMLLSISWTSIIFVGVIDSIREYGLRASISFENEEYAILAYPIFSILFYMFHHSKAGGYLAILLALYTHIIFYFPATTSWYWSTGFIFFKIGSVFLRSVTMYATYILWICCIALQFVASGLSIIVLFGAILDEWKSLKYFQDKGKFIGR